MYGIVEAPDACKTRDGYPRRPDGDGEQGVRLPSGKCNVEKNKRESNRPGCRANPHADSVPQRKTLDHPAISWRKKERPKKEQRDVDHGQERPAVTWANEEAESLRACGIELAATFGADVVPQTRERVPATKTLA